MSSTYTITKFWATTSSVENIGNGSNDWIKGFHGGKAKWLKEARVIVLKG